MNQIVKTEPFRLKLPIKSDLKRWLQKCLNAEEVILEAGVNEFGKIVKLACVEGSPKTEKVLSFDAYDDYIFVLIPQNHHIPTRNILEINQLFYDLMIAQLVLVSVLKKQELKASQAAVIEYYQNHFGIQMTTEALEKASQRFRAQRKMPRFITRQ